MVYFWRVEYAVRGEPQTRGGCTTAPHAVNTLEDADLLREQIELALREDTLNTYGVCPDVDSIKIVALNPL